VPDGAALGGAGSSNPDLLRLFSVHGKSHRRRLLLTITGRLYFTNFIALTCCWPAQSKRG
jgi:hypothetical protein